MLTSALGFLLSDNPELKAAILDSALSQFPIVGGEVRSPEGLRGSTAALAIGALVALYGALGVTQALQHVLNVLWAVPRNRRPNPLRARLRSVLLLGTAGLALLATTILSALAGRVGTWPRGWGRGAAVGLTGLTVLIYVAVFIAVFRIATTRDMRARDVIRGAIMAAVLWQLLQLFGAAYVASVLDGASMIYGTFALVLGLLAWIYLAALSIVLSVEMNVVYVKQLYPRALLTLFVDNVDLTEPDRRIYTDAAAAQQIKENEVISVSFEPAVLPNPRQAACAEPGVRTVVSPNPEASDT